MGRLGLMGSMMAALLSGCAAVQEHVKQPQVDLRDVQVVAMSLADAQLAFDFDVRNPNPIGISMRDLSYRLELADKIFTSGSLGERLRIGANQQSRLTLPLTLRYSDVLDSLAELGRSDALEYRISGKADFGLFAIPYSQSGSVPLPRLPDVSVQSLRVENLSLSGAQLRVDLRMINTNRFPIRFNGLDYQVKLGDASVLNGESAQPFSLEPNRTGTLPLRLKLDYGQIANVTQAIREGRSLPVAFTGNLKVPGASGEVTLPYRWSGDVPLMR
ncbi:LEA type 2 family protein [Thiohalomonas denitrificans]|uniref:LEA14-like dessication related protein n=1 Tax=Thiohalomonas denitrificans TaxID=415747 RepID=A0A1G5QQH1_9GAMM|nr:LEA type 2 family protein [Thiohalomonas denitrificans]SCZ64095.1 LEA14-like dessication related protein [Thiohalomonas denitrificans]